MPPRPAFLIREKSLAISPRSTDASGTQYLPTGCQHEAMIKSRPASVDLNRGLTCADGVSNVPKGMSGFT